MLAWLADPEHSARPKRVADVVAIQKGGAVFDGLVDLDVDEEKGRVLEWGRCHGVQPLVSMIPLEINTQGRRERGLWKRWRRREDRV